MINANFFLGYPVNFKDICNIYPPKVKDLLKCQDYYIYKKLLLSSQEDLEDEWVELNMPMDQLPSPFKYLFIMSQANKRMHKLVSDSISFFIKEPVLLLKDINKILIGEVADLKGIKTMRFISEEDYFDFQNLLRMSIGEKEIEPYNPNENEKIKYFKAKARLRDRVKAKLKDGLNLGSTLASICCMDLGINPLNIGELSQASIPILTRYYQEKHKYEIDIQSLLAGADSKKVKPQNWIRNIEDL